MRLRKLLYTLRRHRLPFLILTLLSLLEIYIHTLRFHIPRPAEALDPPFSTQCRDASDPTLKLSPDQSAPDVSQPRENAAIVMLARNSDLAGAQTAIRSLEAAFNRHYRYPIIFFNNEPFTSSFKSALSAATAAHTSFETIPQDMWSYPAHVSQARARRAMHAMERGAGGTLPYVGKESYHHMCRFNSGFFFDHPALLPYRWYWRVEPDVDFTCAIPYDPFARMAQGNKTYGYALALWEVGSTSPGLFRAVADYKTRRGIQPAGALWTAMMDASWAPWLVRRLLLPRLPSLFHSRDAAGDAWNFCHFWSNFEVADLAFFRGREYRDFFAALDEGGGFYYERWGDAPVHSLAVALFLNEAQVHWFGDLGYGHPPFQNCPTGRGVDGKGGYGNDVRGCGCDCDAEVGSVPDVCIRRLREAVDPG